MKNRFQPVILTLALALLVTASIHSQTTYDLPSGKSLTVINQLPETLSSYFDEASLADRLGGMEPAFDWRVGASISNDQLQFVFMIPEYFPEEPPVDLYDQPFQPGNRRLLPINIPAIYMLQLHRWYRSAWHEMPDDLKLTLNDYQVSYFTIFQKGGHWLMFSGATNRSTPDSPQITQPIVSNNPRYGEVRIWADTHGYYSSFQRAAEQGYYPLDRPIDPVTGDRNTSWLIYDFFEMAPEE